MASVDTAHLETWKSARSSNWERAYPELNTTIRPNFDHAIAHGEQILDVMARLDAAKQTPEVASLLDKFPSGPVSIPLEIKDESDQGFPPAALAETAMADFFIAMNLASPGCVDMGYGRFLAEPTQDSEFEVLYSNYYFEAALLEGDEGNWPAPIHIPFETVWTWFVQVRDHHRLLPSNRTERAIFAMLHLCQSMSTSPESIVWIFYALESLLDTKTGENRAYLLKRAALILKPTETQLKAMKEQLRKLYDMRSAFVHGGLEVVHPVKNEFLDKRIDAQYEKLMVASDFGVRLLICLIQHMIMQSKLELNFSEVLE